MNFKLSLRFLFNLFFVILLLALTACDDNPPPPVISKREPVEPAVLPVLKIDTQGRNIDSKEIWMTGATYELFDGEGALLIDGETEIRGRGNTTWGMPKKPYNLRLASNQALLGMSAHNRWSLLANYADKTLLRTEITFSKLASIYDSFAWTPSSRFVELYLNGSYDGVYQLTESIRASNNRVKFNSISSTNPNGGFLLEVCNRLEDEYNFTTTHEGFFNCSSPDSNLDVLINGTNMSLFEKIRSYIQGVEDVLYNDNLFTNPTTGWQKYLEMNSFIDYYLVNEITRNCDAQFWSSTYMFYDDAIGKLRMGPLWDFDISMGNIYYNDCFKTDGFYIYYAKWINRLFKDPVFVAAVKARWNDKYRELITIYDFIDERADYLADAQAENFKRWDILKKYVWPNYKVPGSYAGEIRYLKRWLRERIIWLNSAINKL